MFVNNKRDLYPVEQCICGERLPRPHRIPRKPCSKRPARSWAGGSKSRGPEGPGARLGRHPTPRCQPHSLPSLGWAALIQLGETGEGGDTFPFSPPLLTSSSEVFPTDVFVHL